MHVCVIVRRGRGSPLRSAVDLRFRRGSEIMKNYTQGRVENQRKSEAGRVLGALGAVLGIFGALCWELLAKLGRRWAQDDRSWGQDGVKSRPRWAMKAPRGAMIAPRWGMIAPRWELNLGASGAVLRAFFNDFRR